MKYLLILISCFIICIKSSLGQTKPDSKFFYLQLSQLSTHVGDSVCIYGSVNGFKVEGDKYFIDIDSAGYSKTQVEYEQPDSNTRRYLPVFLKSSILLIYGTVDKEGDRMIVKSDRIIPVGDNNASNLALVKGIFTEHRQPDNEMRVKITNVVLLPPPPLSNSSKTYYTKRLNKKIDRCDNIARKTLSADGKTVELQMFGDMLFLLFEKPFWEKIGLPVSVDLTGKPLCFNGVLIRYKGVFAVKIKDIGQVKFIDK